MKALLTIAFAIAISFSGSVMASPLIEATKTCLADNTSGKDRKLLGKWIFLAIAAHPEIKSLSSASQQDQEGTSRAFADLFMRLVTVDCKNEMRTMMAEEGSSSMKTAFEFLGQIAMQEIMTNESVNSSISEFEKFVDNEKLSSALAPQQGTSN